MENKEHYQLISFFSAATQSQTSSPLRRLQRMRENERISLSKNNCNHSAKTASSPAEKPWVWWWCWCLEGSLIFSPVLCFILLHPNARGQKLYEFHLFILNQSKSRPDPTWLQRTTKEKGGRFILKVNTLPRNNSLMMVSYITSWAYSFL